MPTEENKSRTFAEVSAEFNAMMARTGALQFNIQKMQADLALLNKELDALHIEWKEAKAAADAKNNAPEAPAASPEATQSV